MTQIKQNVIAVSSPLYSNDVVNKGYVDGYIESQKTTVNDVYANKFKTDDYFTTIEDNVVNIRVTPRASGYELEDYFGSSLIHQWRPDQENWAVSSGVVVYVDDRITKRVSSRITGSTGPVPSYASSVFNNHNALDFGVVERHSRRLYTTDITCSATNPFIQFCVWSLTSTPTQGVWLLGNGDATVYGYHGLAPTGYVNYPNSMINTEEGPIDLTSRLAYASIIGIFDVNNPRSRGLIIRSDGRIWHTMDGSGCGAVTGQASGVPCVGNTNITGSYGAPCLIADYAIIQNKILTQRDVSAFLYYLKTQYGFTMPVREVLWDGNSLHAACRAAFYSSVLPNTNARFFSAVASRAIPAVIGALKETANSRTCLTINTEKIYIGNEVVNSIINGDTSTTIITNLTRLFTDLKIYGYNKIIYGTCMASSTITGLTEIIREEVNAWLVSQFENGIIDELVNLHTTDIIDGQSCPESLIDPTNTIYFIDGLHLTTVGYNIYFSLWYERMIKAGC